MTEEVFVSLSKTRLTVPNSIALYASGVGDYRAKGTLELSNEKRFLVICYEKLKITLFSLL